MIRSLLGILPLLLLVNATTDTDVPRLDLVRPEIGYHGLVKENERVVEVTPRIHGVGARICGFRIVNKHHGEAPFELKLVDPSTGEGVLTAKKDLNCEKRKNYKFDIAAVSCQGKHSPNATVHVSVVDVNEYEPVFLESSYVVQVDEGRLYDSIIQVEAADEDCSPKYGDICKYEILTADQPFVIDAEGKIKNTEPLEWDKTHNYILSVVAYDCGMRRSKSVLVTVKVNRVCRLGWKDVDERIEYIPGSGSMPLFPRAHLELCEVPCQVERVSTKVTLTTRHIGKGCDRDTYSVDSQRKLCGASSDSIDLLPSPDAGTEWTHSLRTDDGHESDQIYEFDGTSNAVIIPSTTLNHNLTDRCTISTWMKHAGLPQTHSHVRENIICNADDHKRSRPHYALFVRNCRLILLLRRDYTEESLNTFKPAEWRWKLPQVCDDEWHHYAVNIEFPDVTLYLDGQKFPADAKNPEIIDDWPLHPTSGINTTLVVGACWQGTENKMGHYFKGFLAGISVLRGHVEKPQVLSCLHRCKESLEVPSMEYLEPGMQLLNNNELTEVSIEGNNRTNLETLMRHIAYLNSREFPTPGRRSIHVTTSVQCTNLKTLKVPSFDGYVMVLQQETPVITINGTGITVCTYDECLQGIKMFQSISISATDDHTREETTERDNELKSHLDRKLDSCTVSVYPPLNPEREFFRMPENKMDQLGIKYKLNKDGIIITGADMIFNYEDIIRHIHYHNNKAAYYLHRSFKVLCSELNGRFVSNEYIHRLTVLHPQIEKKSEKKVAHAKLDHHRVEYSPGMRSPGGIGPIPPGGEPAYLDSNTLYSSDAAGLSSASHTVTVIIVVCVGFLVFMIVLGVIRIRAAHQRAQESRDEDQEMAWDDSSLTITVNPMEQIEEEEHETTPLHDEDDSDGSSDNDDDNSSYRDEDDEDDDDQGDSSDDDRGKGSKGSGVHTVNGPAGVHGLSVKKVSAGKVRGELEWDDSTLTF